MGALFGFFDTVGRHMQEQNRVELEHQTKANAEMADMLDNLAKTAKPQYAPDYFRAAMQIRMTPPGKKPPKEATDIYSLMLRQVKSPQPISPAQSAQPGQSAQPSQPTQGRSDSDPNTAFVDPSATPSLMPPPGMSPGMPPGTPAMRTEPVSGAGMASLLPPPSSASSASSSQAAPMPTAQPAPGGSSMPTPPPGYGPPPGYLSTQVDPIEMGQYQTQVKQHMIQQERNRLAQEAMQLFPNDPYARANYINDKTVAQPSASDTSNRWASAGQGIIYNTATGETKLLTPEEQKYIEVSPGAALFDPKTGKQIYVAPARPDLPNTPFEAMLADFRRTNNREPTQEEVTAMQRRIATVSGEPMYQVVGPGGAPVWTPRSQAIGAPAPRTVYDLSGNPSTGGVPGVALTPPPGISDTTQQSLAGLKNSIGQFQNVDKMLSQPKFSTLGPLLGRVKLAEINKLGGMGATPDEIELAVTLQRLLSSQAFSEGGKQLTNTELEQFKLMTPSFNDTVASAVVKTRQALKFLNAAYQNRISVMPPRQRGQLPDTGIASPGSPAIAPPPSKTSSTGSTVGGKVVKWGRDAQGKPVPLQ